MSVLKLEFESLKRPWHLLPTVFDDFNLLVGLSGVGKTRTLRMLSRLGRAARGKAYGLADCRWSVDVRTTQGVFTWSARTTADPSAAVPDDEDDVRLERFPPYRPRGLFLEEQIRDQSGVIVASRSEDDLVLRDQPIPRLRSRDSLVSLIDEEPIASLREALGGIHFCRALADTPPLYDKGKLDRLIEETASFEALKADRKLDLITKAFILKREFPREFLRVQSQFVEIFGTVEELDIGQLSRYSAEYAPDGPFDLLVPAFREQGIDGWVDGFEMSNGMRRTLLHLFEVHLEPPGSVLLIDEYENGMGVNCLPQVTQTLLERSGEVQLIFTSHHPYVINNVSKDFWRVMRRTGHDVEVLRPGDIARLSTSSSIDGFIQLINAPEFNEGLA